MAALLHGLVVRPALAAVQISESEVEPAASLGSRGRRRAAPDPLALGPDVRGGPRAASPRFRLDHDLSPPRRDGVTRGVWVCSGRKVSLLMRLPCTRINDA
jgi:hypothetical protein